MSLINQMLRDLDRRKGERPAGGAVPPACRRPAPRRSPGLILAFVAVAALAAVAGWLAWEQYAGNGPARNASTSAAQTPVAAVPTPVTPPPATTPAPARPSPAARPERQPAPIPPRPPAKPAPTAPVVEPAPVRKAEAPPRERPPVVAASPSRATTPPADETRAAGSVRKSARPVTSLQRAEEHYRRAYTLLSRGQVEAGEAALRQALAADAGHDKARELLALVMVRAGRYVEAGELLREGLAIHPGNRQQVQILAQVLDHQGRTAEAVQLLERHRPVEVAVDPDMVALLAAYYRKQKRHAEAADLYRRLTAARPDNGLWWIGLGLSLEALARPEAARKAFRKARATGSLTAPLRKFVAERLAATAPKPEEAPEE